MFLVNMCIIIVCLFASTFVLHVSGRNHALRIIGGSDVAEDELPYVARIRLNLFVKSQGITLYEEENHVCTCAIFTPIWTLTAAHCILAVEASRSIEQDGIQVKYEFILGHGPLEKKYTSKIVQWMRHPAFKYSALPFRGLNDIGLVKTEEIVLTKYGHISAMDYTSLLGLEATATGYGLMNVSGEINDASVLGKPLQKLDVVVTKCGPIFETLRPRMCIARRCGKVSTICPGDSGGPLLHSSGIIAVNSAGIAIACNPATDARFLDIGGLTPTSPYIDWISDVINKDTTN